MVARKIYTDAAARGGPLHDIGKRPVVPEEIHVYRGEAIEWEANVSGYADRFEKDLRHDHG